MKYYSRINKLLNVFKENYLTLILIKLLILRQDDYKVIDMA